MTFIWVSLLSLALVAAGLSGLRWLDARAAQAAWDELVAQGGVPRGIYDPESVAMLPAPAQRYFNFSIAPGTPLVTAVEIEMHGALGMGSIEEPGYKAMRAQQILAPLRGFIWRVQVGAIGGSDGLTETTSWTTFRLFGLIPVVRVSGNRDHFRSAFGRLVAEAAFWAPAALLPGEHVRWEAVDDNSARAIVSIGELVQAVDLAIAGDGRPVSVVIQRWSNENPAKVYREQPFGGYLGDFRRFDGYMLPTTVEGGNHFGTDDYFPFYKAVVDAIRLPARQE